MLKWQMFLCFARPQRDVDLCPVGAQRFEGHDLGKSVLNMLSSFIVTGLSLVTDLQRSLKRRSAIFAEEDVDRLFPFA